MKEKSLKKNYILYLIKTVSSLLFPMITFVYTTHVLSVEGIGKVDFSRSVVSYFTLFASLGVTSYGIREGAKVKGDQEKLSRLVKELFTINICTSIFTYIIFFLSLIFIEKFQEYKFLLAVSGLGIGCSALGLEWLYSALEEYECMTVRTVICQIISLILLFLFVRDADDYNFYAAILVLSTAGGNIFNIVHARKYISLTFSDRMELKKHIKPIFVFFTNAAAGNIYVTLDTSMTGLLSSDYAVGLYAAANKMNRICLSVIVSLSVILLPRLSYYLSIGKMDKYKDLLKKCFECALALAIPAASGMFLLSGEILTVFSGTGYIPATLCSKIMSVIIILIPLSTIAANQILIPYGKEKYQLYATLAGTVTNITANFLLIPRYAQTGAAVGTVLAEFMVTACALYFSAKCINYRFVLKNIWHYILSSCLMLSCIWMLKFIMTAPAVRCIVIPAAGAAVYGLGLALLKDSLFLEVSSQMKNMILRLSKQM